MINRHLTKTIEKYLFKGKILIIYGARQVGKTTLAKEILTKHGSEEGYFNCELLSVKRQLESLEPHATKRYLGDHRIIVLDEAQKIVNIGLVLKQLIDTYPEIQIIATGSSSFDLANKINEPLTGRAFEFKLFPLSMSEIIDFRSKTRADEELEKIIIYGTYPEVYLSSESTALKLIETIASQYLYRDILELEDIKKPETLINLLELLALQLGNEVSIHELATQLRVTRDTIDRYLDLLQKSFVIFSLRAFSRNLRKEITKKHKIYFYDTGIRNAILNRYNKLRLRNDVSALWENFIIVERMKLLEYSEQPTNTYFWRTHDQKEVDYIEELSDTLHAYEFKWGDRTASVPQDFKDTYPNSTFSIIHRLNYLEFVV